MVIRKKKAPLCKCGCGMPVKWSIPKKKWNPYLKGHWVRGRQVSVETREKMREIAKQRGFFTTYNKTQEHREKVIKSNRSRVLSEETKQKIANTLLGFKHSEKTKQKMRETKRNNPRVGEFAPNWQGGMQEYGERWFSTISTQIKERDGRCIYCGSTEAVKVNNKTATKIQIKIKKYILSLKRGKKKIKESSD